MISDFLYLQNQFTEKGATYIFNHVHLILSYHKGTPKSGYTDGRIVRARIQLASCDSFPCSDKAKPMKIPAKLDKKLQIPYTYTVEFTVSFMGWGESHGVGICTVQ